MRPDLDAINPTKKDKTELVRVFCRVHPLILEEMKKSAKKRKISLNALIADAFIQYLKSK